jgi:hypothetical protein
LQIENIKILTLKKNTMKKLFFILAVSGLVFASCGKKAEPVVEPTPAPQEVVAPAPTPEPEAKPAPAPKPTNKETVKPAESKSATPATITQKEQVKTAPATPKVLTLEEKLKIFDQLSPEEQKAVLKEVEEKKNAQVGTTTKTSKKK